MTDADQETSTVLEPERKPQSFAPGEMITCDACLRSNPPNRSHCLYCAAILPGAVAAPRKSTAPEVPGEIESFANPNSGFCVVLEPNQTSENWQPAEIAALLNLKNTDLDGILQRGGAVPLARAATTEQARTMTDRLRALGLRAEIVPEDALDLSAPPKKIRALEISDDRLVLTTANGERTAVTWEDLILIVNGRLLVNRVEVKERRRRGRSQPLGSRELSADDPVVDLYARSANVGGRISSGGFDFSCLGAAKALTAFENFATLVKLLGTRAPNVEVDDSYRSLRPMLANVWPPETQTRKGEWQRSGAGKMDTSTVTTTDNEAQFHRYSRLRRHLKQRELEGGR